MLPWAPDLILVQTLSQFASRPSKEHWQAIKRVLRYLQGTRELGSLTMTTVALPTSMLLATLMQTGPH